MTIHYKAYRLYLDHGGNYLPVPDPDDLLAAATDGRLFGCWKDQDSLLAVGGLFWVGRCCRDADRRPIAVYELAGMVVHPDGRRMRPHSLQDILLAVRVAALRVQQDYNVCLISSVAAGNSASRRSMHRCGLVELNSQRIPSWLVDLRRTWLAERRPTVSDYIVPPAAVPALENLVRSVQNSAASRQHGSGDHDRFRIRLQVAVSSLRTAPQWQSDVPPIRLLGQEPPYLEWP